MLRGRLLDLTISLDGKQRLTVELDADFRAEYDELHGEYIDLTVKKYREKRSNGANAYAWVLIDKIAAKQRMSKTEVYRNAIRDIGGVSEIVCCQDKAVRRMTELWQRNGIGWFVEELDSKIPGCRNLVLYKGSSVYDTKQMSQLIDSLVQDAKAIGIETRSPKEIQSLLEEYNDA
jgi:hypothetical protein